MTFHQLHSSWSLPNRITRESYKLHWHAFQLVIHGVLKDIVRSCISSSRPVKPIHQVRARKKGPCLKNGTQDIAGWPFSLPSLGDCRSCPQPRLDNSAEKPVLLNRFLWCCSRILRTMSLILLVVDQTIQSTNVEHLVFLPSLIHQRAFKILLFFSCFWRMWVYWWLITV